MLKYTIKQQKGEPNWEEAPVALINKFNWNCVYQPLSKAQVVLLSDGSLAVRLWSYEENPQSVCDHIDGPVYKDSCIEFFFNAYPKDSDVYLNFECNHKGALFINYGGEIDWHQRKKTADLGLKHPDITCFTGKDEDGDYWGVSYVIPPAFLEKVYGKKELPKGHKMIGSFFKCGDDTPHPHFGSWNEISFPRPNFHLPQYFGTLEID